MNCGPLASEATALPTEAQPLPTYKLILSDTIIVLVAIQVTAYWLINAIICKLSVEGRRYGWLSTFKLEFFNQVGSIDDRGFNREGTKSIHFRQIDPF